MYPVFWPGCTGVVEISPSVVAPACQVGDPLELTCTTTTGIFHRWEFTVFPENVTHTTAPITSIGTSGVPPPLTISTSLFTFSRLSGQNSSPLISRMVVSPVSGGLNGTVVNCFESASSTDSVATTTIQIIDPGRFGKHHSLWKGCMYILGTSYTVMINLS